MKELSIREIIVHSQRVEQESYAFYDQASRLVTDEDVKPLLRDLALEEIRHFNNLRDLLEEERVDETAMAARVAIEVDLFERFVKTHEITAASTREGVLRIALERERNTEAMYSMLLSFTNLDDRIVGVFENLRLQEVGHAARIKALMARIR
jgi:rubrerythrin